MRRIGCRVVKLAATSIFLACTSFASADPCIGKGTILLVEARSHVLSLCEGGRRVRSHRVAIGPAGVGKRREGDGKVPLGRYTLAAPVASKDYHLFMLIGYPTREQRRAGYTGSAVGVHGPPRCCVDPTSTDTDWTLGCIAVGTDEDIESIAAWRRRRGVAEILIEPN